MQIIQKIQSGRVSRFVVHRNWHKHPLFVPAITFIALLCVTLVGFIVLNGRQAGPIDGHVVILSHDKRRETLPTRAATVGEFLTKAGISLEEGDVVEPAQETAIDDDNFRINVYRARPVVIIDGQQKTFAFSAATTARSVADQVGVKVYPEDSLNRQAETNFVTGGAIGERVVIDRATPTNLNLYGTQVTVRTHAKTVGQLLKEKKVSLAKDDQVQPALDTPLTAQSQIFVTRNGVQIKTIEEPIAMEVETVQDNSLSFGTSAIRQQGSAGKKLVTYQITLKNDKEVARQVIQTVVAVEPVKHIVARGKAYSIPDDKSSLLAAAGVAQSDFPYVNYIISHESGWCATKLQGKIGTCPPYPPSSIPSGLGYGLCQSTPGSKMASAGADWQANPVTQLKWCSNYAKRYGGWEGAYNFWLKNHWW